MRKYTYNFDATWEMYYEQERQARENIDNVDKIQWRAHAENKRNIDGR